MTSFARIIILFCIIASSVIYFYIVPGECATNQAETCLDFQAGIVNHNGESPYKYRPLAPMLVQLFVTNGSEAALITGALIFHVICFTLLYPGMYGWLKYWTTEDRALIGLLLFVALLPVIFKRYFLSSYSTFELLLIVYFLIALAQQARFGILVGLMLLAALTRETGIVLAFVYLAWNWDKIRLFFSLKRDKIKKD